LKKFHHHQKIKIQNLKIKINQKLFDKKNHHFFIFFNSIEIPTEENEEELDEELHEKISVDYEMAFSFRKDIVPNGLICYMESIAQDDDEDMIIMEGEDDDDDDENDDEQGDNDDDDDDEHDDEHNHSHGHDHSHGHSHSNRKKRTVKQFDADHDDLNKQNSIVKSGSGNNSGTGNNSGSGNNNNPNNPPECKQS